MKKLLCVVMAAVLIFSLCACGESAPAETLSTDYMDITGIYVDNSYDDGENGKLGLLYIFYTVHTDAENLKVDSKSAKITVGDVNTYESNPIPGACKYAKNYYYSSYLEDVYAGDELKVVETFKVAKGDLEPGKSITFDKYQVPDTEKLIFSTDDIVLCENAEEIAKNVDPEGYQMEVTAREEADDATKKKVKNAINGYYFSFYVNPTSYKLEFISPNKFELTALGNTNSGTYTVRNNYIFLKYHSNGYTVELPYSFNSTGEIELDVVAAFDAREN